MNETISEQKQGYIGRFAPSPTGPLHFGSLVAAVGSFLQARAHGGRWLVRIEDIDPPREVAGAADLILRTLEAHGLEWDGAVMYQSRRAEAYRHALKRLEELGLAYACICSRKQIAEIAAALGLPAGVYAGTCRSGGGPNGNGQRSVRVLTADAVIDFEDWLQGRQRQALDQEVGDFVVLRADGQFAYQLAVVVDDAEQGITEVVRGSDLLDSTPRQIHLQRLLGLASPHYLHLPVAVNADNEKLSKQTHAPALSLAEPLPALWQALCFLGQGPPVELLDGDLEDFWPWAVSNWRPAALPPTLAAPLPGDPPLPLAPAGAGEGAVVRRCEAAAR